MPDDLNSYLKNKAFLQQVRDKIISLVANRRDFDVNKYSSLKIEDALRKLDKKRISIIIARLDKKKTLREIGAEQGFCHQRVYQLEQTAYQQIIATLEAPPPAPPEMSWEDQPLTKAECTCFSDIASTLPWFCPGLINKLRENGYRKTADLCAATPKQLMTIKGIGQKSVVKIQHALLDYENRHPEDFPYSFRPKKKCDLEKMGIITDFYALPWLLKD